MRSLCRFCRACFVQGPGDQPSCFGCLVSSSCVVWRTTCRCQASKSATLVPRWAVRCNVPSDPHVFFIDFVCGLPLLCAVAGVDNGYLRFDHVRVSRDAMLSKLAQIDDDGRYVVKPSTAKKANYGTMVITAKNKRISCCLESVAKPVAHTRTHTKNHLHRSSCVQTSSLGLRTRWPRRSRSLSGSQFGSLVYVLAH